MGRDSHARSLQRMVRRFVRLEKRRHAKVLTQGMAMPRAAKSRHTNNVTAARSAAMPPKGQHDEMPATNATRCDVRMVEANQVRSMPPISKASKTQPTSKQMTASHAKT